MQLKQTMNPILQTKSGEVVQAAFAERTPRRSTEPRSDIPSNSRHVCDHVQLFEQDRGRAWRKAEWAFKKKADPVNSKVNAANRRLMKAIDGGNLKRALAAMQKLQEMGHLH
jgi:hypothetical protein